MKRIAQIWAILASLLLYPSVSAQNISLKLRNVTVQEAITALNQTESYSIILNSDAVDLNRKVSVSAQNAPITEVLAQVFAGQNVDFVINGHSISVIAARPQPQSQQPQPAGKTDFRGKVTDSSGEPLIGASLKIVGTDKGFITDIDGNFSLTDMTFPLEAIVSFIGYSDTRVRITGKEPQPWHITLDDSQNLLDEIVVVGYGTQKKSSLSGSVSIVSGKELNSRPVVSAANALQGTDPATNISFGTGSPEGSYSINIRGALSLNSGSPLVLADGVEVSLSQINPNDIESISILKDASSCAIYGT